MMRVCWPAAAGGHYWLDIALGTLPCQLMLDTGLVDPRGQVGLEIDPSMFDLLEQSGQLLAAGIRSRLDASGKSVALKVGFVTAGVINPMTLTAVGPSVRCLALRSFAGVHSRVGVVFFHRMSGCRVVWELDRRTWCVEYP